MSDFTSIEQLSAYISEHGKLPPAVADPDTVEEYMDYVDTQIGDPEDLDPTDTGVDREAMAEAYRDFYVKVCMIMGYSVDDHDAWELFMGYTDYGEAFRGGEED